MNQAQIDLAKAWDGAHDETYFDQFRALDRAIEPAADPPVDDDVQEVQPTSLRVVPPVDHQPVADLAAALNATVAFLRRYVVFSRPQTVDAVALWCIHTHAIDYADATGYLGVSSPDKGSGKTRLLECLRLLARGRPGILIIPTASTIYRMLEADPSGPLILDELDAVFRDRSDKFEEVRAVINAGHRRGATVPRSVPGPKNTWKVQHFPVFGPRVLSGIGKLPDTLADRSIPIRMLKRKRSEPIEKFRGVRAEREAEPIYLAIEASVAAADLSREASVPDELPDRAADAWEPLFAIADVAGGDWPSRARRAAIILHADHADDDSRGLRLLADVRIVFDRLDVDRLATAALIEGLKADEESPWVDDHKPLTPERLARYLRPFEIRSTQMKIAGIKVRGFLRESFLDSWARYLPDPGTPRQDAVPRYPERAQGTEVPGYSGGTGVVEAIDTPVCAGCGSRLVRVPDPENSWIKDRWVCTNPTHKPGSAA